MKKRQFTRNRWPMFTLLLALLVLAAAIPLRGIDRSPRNPGLLFVDYRDLKGGADGVALVDLNPDSKGFGAILQRQDIGQGVLPHHLYFNRDQSRLYTSALSGSMLYEVELDKGGSALPRITRIVPVDTGGNLVGEDMYFTKDGSRFYLTFLNGQGGENAGSVGVFDARTNQLLQTIQAPMPADPSQGQPFIRHPHGISANEDLGVLMVTSDAHPEQPIEVGNTVTTIDLATNTVTQTYLVAESWEDESETVEVLLLRDGLPPYALVTTLTGGDIWVAHYDEQSEAFGQFTKQAEGDDHGLGVALEFYIHQDHNGVKELYVTYAQPGVIHVYGLDKLPQLPLKRTLPAAAGAHHMVFFDTPSGREVVVVQNNLLNLDGLNAGTLMVVDIHTGEVLKTLDLAGQYGLMPESIESAFGHGHDYHH